MGVNFQTVSKNPKRWKFYHSIINKKSDPTSSPSLSTYPVIATNALIVTINLCFWADIFNMLVKLKDTENNDVRTFTHRNPG